MRVAAEQLEDTKPMGRQAWTMEDTPFQIRDASNIASFKTNGILTIPQSAFAHTRLDKMWGVCLLSTSVQLIGAPVDTDITVLI